MKKTYTKPQIMFESFIMTTNIAAQCEINKLDDPRLEFSGLGYAFTSKEVCAYEIKLEGGDGEYNGICYHVFTDFNLFNS